MIAISKLDEFDPATSFGAWMSVIVRYTALNEGRKLHRTKAKGTAGSESPPDQGVRVQQSQIRVRDGGFDAKVAAALADIDERARTCLLLRVVRGLSYAAIATTLGLPEGTVMSHVHRAKATLRERLGSMAERGEVHA